MNRILVVEDEVNTSELLRRYFEIVGYNVINAHTGKEAVEMAAEHEPEVIILDIVLPDMDGYEVCKKLRSEEQTGDIPIIFLTTKDARQDRLEGLRLGADDYLAKPFDVEELRLRVHNIIANTGGTPLVDARTSLPNKDLMKERLPKLLEDDKAVFVDVTIQDYEPFKDRYGPVAANQVLRATAKLISDVLQETGNSKSFIGHPQDDQFLIGATEALDKVEDALAKRFDEGAGRYYDYDDQQRKHMLDGDRKVPLMSLKVSRLSHEALRKRVESGGEAGVVGGQRDEADDAGDGVAARERARRARKSSELRPRPGPD